MNQSSTIAAALLAGFALYLAANDRLKVYAAVLWGNTKQSLPSSSPQIINPLVKPGGPSSSGGSSSSGGIPELGGSSSGYGGMLEEAAPLLLESM